MSGRVIYFVYESPHKDRNTSMCVCVCVTRAKLLLRHATKPELLSKWKKERKGRATVAVREREICMTFTFTGKFSIHSSVHPSVPCLLTAVYWSLSQQSPGHTHTHTRPVESQNKLIRYVQGLLEDTPVTARLGVACFCWNKMSILWDVDSCVPFLKMILHIILEWTSKKDLHHNLPPTTGNRLPFKKGDGQGHLSIPVKSHFLPLSSAFCYSSN